MLLLSAARPGQRNVHLDSAGHGPLKDGTTYNGKIIGDEVIQVGARIPRELLKDLKRDPKGGLRLKFRMKRHGSLLLQKSIPAHSNKAVSSCPGCQNRRHAVVQYPSPASFREAYINNGKIIRPGWYVDRKTGRKIEIDY